MNTTKSLFSAIIISLSMLFANLSANNLYAQFSNTLTQEEKDEVEKNPLDIINGCNNKLANRIDAGNLCDSFSFYLSEKCERLDNIPEYCGILSIYQLKRNIQKECISNPPSNPPLPKDVERAEECSKYIMLDVKYAYLPLKLEISRFFYNQFESTGDISFSAINPNSYVTNILSLSYNLSKHGDVIASGALGNPNSSIKDCPKFCFDIGPKSARQFGTIFSDSNSSGLAIDVPFVVNGTYRYEIFNSTISKSFNFTLPGLQFP